MNETFTKKNSLLEILTAAKPQISLFFPDELMFLVPENLRTLPLEDWADDFMMPWGFPFPTDDLLRDANMVMDSENYWRLVPLWSEAGFTPDSNDMHSVCLMVLHNQPEGKRPAVIVCPGGGYENLAFSNEGIQTARRLMEKGYRTFILNYRTGPNRYPDPQTDLALAIQHVRANAEEYQIIPDDLMILGYSAGGHLCASTAALRDEIALNLSRTLGKMYPEKAARYEGISVRPDKVCLGYPVISFLSEQHEGSFEALTGGIEALREHLSVEKQVDPDYPKTFVWTCADDSLVPPSNARRMGQALEEKKIPHMLKVYPEGEHGCSVGEGTSAEGWIDAMADFMKMIPDIEKIW